MDSVNVRWPRG